MKNTFFIAVIFILLAALGFVLYNRPVENKLAPSEQATTTATLIPTMKGKTDMIQVTSHQPNSIVTSPITITGKARGGWYFEASFPVKIVDANGKVLGQHYAQAEGEWMTPEYVNFKSVLTFVKPTTETGMIILENDNPSGMPENADSLTIPIRFGPTTAAETMPIKIYFQNVNQTNADVCSGTSLVAVTRNIPKTSAPLKEALNLMLTAEPTAAEKAQGYTSSFSKIDLNLKSVKVINGVATLELTEGQGVGGSCFVTIIRESLIKTARQFPTVKSVVFAPDDILQP